MSKRIAQFTINWPALAERVPPAQRATFIAFKTKSDNYLRRVQANPAELPKIDWAYYQKYVPIAGMADTFKKQYESLQIPYPPDNYTKLVDAQETEVKADIAKFIADSNNRITDLEKQIAKLDSLIPYDEMTMEDFADAHPDIALNPLKKPTFWPHTADEGIPSPPLPKHH